MQLPKIMNSNELLFQIEKPLLYQDLINQLNKDFEITGTTIDFLKVKSPSKLFGFLEDAISELVQKDFDIFLNLLYRIDINEHQIKEIINQANENVEKQITFLILKREWQKVWLKRNYS